MKDYSKCPVPRMADAVRRYVELGYQPGHFLTALFSNNLSEAVGRADDENQAVLVAWVKFVHNEMPNVSHGSPERVRAWIATRGGLDAASDEDDQACRKPDSDLFVLAKGIAEAYAAGMDAQRTLQETMMGPDYRKGGIFQTHNCAFCRDGAAACLTGDPSRCQYLRARND